MARPKRKRDRPSTTLLQQIGKPYRLCSVACMVTWVVDGFASVPDLTIAYIGHDWVRRKTRCVLCGRVRHSSSSRRIIWASRKELP